MNRRFVAVLTALAIGAGCLAGCVSAPAEISGGTSADMQTAVVALAESAAAGDPAGALQHLDALQQQLDAAIADGSVSAERARAIQDALDLVRADLQPPPAPMVEPSTEPTVDPGDTDDDSSNGNGNGDGESGNSGNGNSGNGNDGNDKGDDKGDD